jgi:GNAT superfamily N-acetyltransferase
VRASFLWQEAQTSPPNDVLLLRLAEPHEVEMMHAVMRAAFIESEARELPSSALDETVDDVRRALADGGAVLALVDGRAVGCLRFRIDGRALVFSRMGVLPEARKRGVGAAMVAYVEAHARRLGLRSVELTARSQQPDNRPYYQRLGYTIVGYSERYGVADLSTHMRKTLE